MGNTASSTAVQRQQAQDTSKSGLKSWATTDHTISGPWSFLVKEHVQCLCEGGRGCTRENPARQKGPNAIPGLHSNWVGGKVLAMARPWQEHVVKYDLVNKFKESNIGMILNLQEVGEHDSCGPGNLPNSGFTYSPEAFMAAKIGFYNFSWRDMGVPTLDKMMDIVQVMHYTTVIEHKRIAVHCHAGLGRTGLAIACFLVASGEASAAQAVEMVRQQRPGALQTSAQVLFVSIFEQYLQHLRCLFQVADLRQLNLGNEGYILTKVCRRISRSMSAHGPAAADPLAAAAAALSSISITGAAGPGSISGSGGSTGNLPLLAAVANGSNSGSGTLKAAAALSGDVTAVGAADAADAAGEAGAADWASASYGPMSPAEASHVISSAEAAANAALNLGSGATDGMMVHARRLSGGGGSLKLVCNLKAIKEETDKPVHVIETDNAVTEVYGHGLTIIRSTQSTKKLQVVTTVNRPTTEQLVLDRLPTETDLGLDNQMPWNEKFHIKPEAFNAESWLPEAPSSYLEALKRQQRLLHGMERRQSLRLHKLLKAAARALTLASQAYNEVPEHWDFCPAAAAAAQPASPLRRTHTRTRSSAAAELLALTTASGSSGPGSMSLTSTSLPSTPTKSALGAGGSASGAAACSGLNVLSGGLGSGAPGASLLSGGIHLGAPGTSPGNSGTSTRASSSGGGGGCSSSCLAGCCAPSFATGLLVALLYKGRYPEEYESQWSLCPRLQALGFAEGHAVCAQLQSVKLALNAGDFKPLESASAAVAVVVLGDWFEGFTSEALTEASLELLIDEADDLLGEALSAAGARAAAQKQTASMDLHGGKQVPTQQQQQQQAGQEGDQQQVKLGKQQRLSSSDQDKAAEVDVFEELDDFLLARKASARAVSCALAAHEQDLFLLLAAVLRHVRHASQDDSRLHSSGVLHDGLAVAGAAAGDGHLPVSLPPGPAAGLTGQSQPEVMGLTQAPQQAVVDGEVDRAMLVLYRVMAGWLLGPLAVACGAALDAVAAFLHYLTVEDVGYSQLLQASREQGLKKSHSQPANYSSDSMESLLVGSSPPATPRSQLRSRLLNSALGSGLVRVMVGSSGGGSGAAAGGGSGAAQQGKGKSKLSHASSSPQLSQTQDGAAATKGRATGELGWDDCSIGCADGIGNMLASKLQVKKVQLPVISSVSSKTSGIEATGAASKQQQQQQQQQPGSQPDGVLSPDSLTAGDSAVSSQVVESGQRALCVGRQKERSTVSPAADLVAEARMAQRQQQGQGQQQQQQLEQQEPDVDGAGMSGELTGLMLSPPRSISPSTSPMPPSGTRSYPARQPGPHHHLPAIRPSAAAMAASAAAAGPAGGSPGSSSSTSVSPLSSGQFAPGQLSGAAHGDSTAPAALGAGSAPGAIGVGGMPSGAGSMPGVMMHSGMPSAVPSSIDVSQSQMLSISALSDIQLPSFASTVSVAESLMVAQSRQSWDNFSGVLNGSLQLNSRSPQPALDANK